MCASQTKIPLWVTGQDEYLQPLPGLFQYPCHTGKAPGVCRNEHVVEDYELALVFGEHVGQRETCREIDLFTFTT